MVSDSTYFQVINSVITDEKIPETYEEVPIVQSVDDGNSKTLGDSNECCDILRNNYGALSQSLNEPVGVAKHLYSQKILPEEVLDSVKSTRGSLFDSRAVLLKAVRDAVHLNYKHLEVFVTVLRKFTETAHIGNAIFKEYGMSITVNNGTNCLILEVKFPEGGTISELQCYKTVIKGIVIFKSIKLI